jgi:hypothetical protein
MAGQGVTEAEAKGLADLIWDLEVFIANARRLSRAFRDLGFPSTADNLTELASRYDGMAARLSARMVAAS